MKKSHEKTLIHIESYFCNRMVELMDQGLLDECDSLFEEFIVDGKEPEDDEWVFLPKEKTK